MVEKVAITNVRVVMEKGIFSNCTVLVSDGRIDSVSVNPQIHFSEDWAVIDGYGQLLIPGMIDVHIHGANGYDMMDGSLCSIAEVSRMCARTGCTSFLVTSVSSSFDDLTAMLNSVQQMTGQEPGAHIAGVHLEGPYLHPARKGMQPAQHLRHPDLNEMNYIINKLGNSLKMVTLAPELPGGLEMIKFLHDQGIVVALAHSDATYEQAKEAFSLGASHVTHCFNAMRPIHHRDPGLVVAAFEEEHVSLQAIVDHVHLHPAIVRLMFQVKGANRMVLITDALQAMGKGDGDYVFGGHNVCVSGGIARLQDGTLASSTVTMNEALRKTVASGIPLWDVVTMATRTPADLLGLPNKGRIRPGADADLVLLNDKFDVIWTMIEGLLFR